MATFTEDILIEKLCFLSSVIYWFDLCQRKVILSNLLSILFVGSRGPISCSNIAKLFYAY